MAKYYFLFFSLFSQYFAIGQNDYLKNDSVIYSNHKSPSKFDKKISDYLNNKSVPLGNVTDTSDFKDLLFLKNEIQNKKVVFLGESTHEIEEFNQLNNRSIRFLHEKMGFNVIVWESGFNESTAMNFQRDLFSAKDFLLKTAYNVWGNEYNIPLINYAKRDTSIKIAGMDIISSAPSNSSGFFREWISRIDTCLGNSFYVTDSSLDHYIYTWLLHHKKMKMTHNNLVYTYSKNKDNLKTGDTLLFRFQYFLAEIKKHQTLYTDMEYKILIHSIQNRIALINWYNKTNKSSNFRDSAMASNITWIVNELYPNEKIIVWSANFHIAKQSYKFINMGSLLPDSIKQQSYVLGEFYANEVVLMNGRTYTSDYSRNRFIENIFDQLNYKYSFLNTSPFDNNTYVKDNFLLKSFTTHQGGKVILGKWFDGVIIIKTAHDYSQASNLQ